MNMAAGFREEVCAPWLSNWNGVFMGGMNQHRKLQGTITMDANGGGTECDRIVGWRRYNSFYSGSFALMADVESYEAKNPLLYLFRRQREDSGGQEISWRLRWRGSRHIHNTQTYRLGFRGIGKYIAATAGILEDIQPIRLGNGFIFNSGIKNLSPDEFGKIKSFPDLERCGEFREMTPMAASTPVQDGSLYYLRWMGGGATGIP
jgi:hypothetical protein